MIEIENPDYEASILGHDEDAIGVEIFDERGNRQTINIEWNGEIEEHYFDSDDYPPDPAERTHEERVILAHAEERARYVAQKEFPEADILDPMWDPEHIQRGVDALTKYPLAEFYKDFREYYEALRNPEQFIDDGRSVPLKGALVFRPFRINDDEIVDVHDTIYIQYAREGDDKYFVTGDLPMDWPEEEMITVAIHPLEFEDDFEFEEQFQNVIYAHLLAQIRDIFFHMGERPPEKYLVEGFGKEDIIGRGALE